MIAATPRDRPLVKVGDITREAVDAIESAGFTAQRTLIWMKAAGATSS